MKFHKHFKQFKSMLFLLFDAQNELLSPKALAVAITRFCLKLQLLPVIRQDSGVRLLARQPQRTEHVSF